MEIPAIQTDCVDPIVGFCQSVREKYATNWPPSEEMLADEFIDYFKVKAMVGISQLQKLCEEVGIEFSRTALPKSLCGHNLRYQNKRAILIAESHMLSPEHTVLHEIREQLEYDFNLLGVPILNPDDKEERADCFAVSVRMNAFAKELPTWFEGASTIEKKWRRRGAYALLFLFACVYTLGVTLLPGLEDRINDPSCL